MKNKYYKKKNGEYYTLLTKEEVRRTIDPYNPATILPLCQIFDIPYIEYEWEKKRTTREQRGKVENTFGAYLSTMKLLGFRSYGYDDSNFLNETYKKNMV